MDRIKTPEASINITLSIIICLASFGNFLNVFRKQFTISLAGIIKIAFLIAIVIIISLFNIDSMSVADVTNPSTLCDKESYK